MDEEPRTPPPLRRLSEPPAHQRRVQPQRPVQQQVIQVNVARELVLPYSGSFDSASSAA